MPLASPRLPERRRVPASTHFPAVSFPHYIKPLQNPSLEMCGSSSLSQLAGAPIINPNRLSFPPPHRLMSQLRPASSPLEIEISESP
ncbi:hypothetical protein Bca4012_052149 [Brassica carinata]|uniref:Uncharacterized protein n=1 Tax=Brassica carinata TaxID=52824 RepID=A0A8X7R8E3_BRACI|nr:hypothetical protein Bca52824_054712 [Brassica carinata]